MDSGSRSSSSGRWRGLSGCGMSMFAAPSSGVSCTTSSSCTESSSHRMESGRRSYSKRNSSSSSTVRSAGTCSYDVPLAAGEEGWRRAVGSIVSQQNKQREARSGSSSTSRGVMACCCVGAGGSTSSCCCSSEGREISKMEGRTRKSTTLADTSSAAPRCHREGRWAPLSVRRCLVVLSIVAVVHALRVTAVSVLLAGEAAAASVPLFAAVSCAFAAAAATPAAAAAQAVPSSSISGRNSSSREGRSSPSSKQRMRILYPPRPLQVVRPNDRHTGFEIDEEALAFLEEIPAPVSVVAAVGSIHTGKSFFLSQLLAFSSPHETIYYDSEEQPTAATGAAAAGGRGGRLTAFPVGYTVQPGTQGLTFWSEPLRVNRRTGAVLPPLQPSLRNSSSSSNATGGARGDAERGQGGEWMEVMAAAEGDEEGETDADDITNVLLLDTEGFGGPNVTRSYDQLLYAVASLLSSHILFTTMKMIDAQSLQLLEDMTKDANLFNLRAHAQALSEASSLRDSSSLADGSRSTYVASDAAAGWSSNNTGVAAAAQGGRTEEEEAVEAADTKEEEESRRRSSTDNAEASRIRKEEEEGKETPSSSAGSLLFSSLTPCCLSWVVQDFVQDLEDVTAQQWLQRLIDTNRWSSSAAAVEKQYWRETRQRRAAAEGGAAIAAADEETTQLTKREGTAAGGDGDPDYLKHSLRSFYEWIDCVALPSPAANADALQRLDLLPLHDLTEAYRREFNAFRMQLLLRAARRYKVKNALTFQGEEAEEDRQRRAAAGRPAGGSTAAASSAGSKRSGTGRWCPAGAAGAAGEQQQCAAAEAEAAAAAGDEEHRQQQQLPRRGEATATAAGQGEMQQHRRGGGSTTTTVYQRPMSGRDLAALLRFLVRAANMNMFQDVQIFMNHFSAVRSELTKNDLLLLYEEDMKQFLRNYPPPLPPSFFRFADQLQQQVMQQWQQQTRGLLEDAAATPHTGDAQQQRQLHDALTKALQEKLEYFRATAEEQVRLYCRGFCEKQVQQIEQHVQQQQQRLPISPQALSEWSIHEQRLQRSLLAEEVDRDGVSYSSADVCAEELRAYEATVENLFLYFHKENTKKIYEHMQAAEAAAVSFFSEQLQQHPLELLRPLEEFRVLLFEWKAAAWDIFEHRVADLRTVREAYVAFEEKLRGNVKKLEQHALQQWNTRCAEISSEVLKKWDATYKAEVVASFPRVQALPVDEDILTAAAANKAQEAMQELNDIYCAKASPWQKVSREMKEVLHARQKELETQNVEAIKITCKEPLDRLTKTLQAKDFFLWGSFAAVARREAAAVLSAQHPQVKTAAAASSIVLSDRLIKKVTDHWIDTDLRKAHAATIRQNFNNLLYQILGTICLAVGIAVVAVWSFGGTPLIFFGLWCIFGFATLLSWLREAFKFTVEGLWNGLQNRLGFEVAAGTCFLAAAMSGGFCWRWWTSRRTNKTGYGAPLYTSTCMPPAYSADPMAPYTACGAQVPLSSLGQSVDFQQSMGLPRCSVLPNASFVSDLYPDTGRRSRFSSATYLGGQQ